MLTFIHFVLFSQFEKEKLEKQVRRLDGDKESLTEELSGSQSELTRLKNDFQIADREKEAMKDQLQDAIKEKEKISNDKEEVNYLAFSLYLNIYKNKLFNCFLY